MLADISLPFNPPPVAHLLWHDAEGGLLPWQCRKVALYVDQHLNERIGIDCLAGLVRLSRSHFSRGFKHSFGRSPYRFVMERRAARARNLMRLTDQSLSQIAVDCGFTDQAHLSNLFRKVYGQSPNQWRRFNRPPDRCETRLLQRLA